MTDRAKSRRISPDDLRKKLNAKRPLLDTPSSSAKKTKLDDLSNQVSLMLSVLCWILRLVLLRKLSWMIFLIE